MKKLVILTALTMAAPAAMASKARVEALNNSRQIVDIQNAFDRPYQFMQLGSQATFEWGGNDSTATLDTTTNPTKPFLDKGNKHGEGGFLVRTDDRAYGAYLGRRSSSFDVALQSAFMAGVFTPGTDKALQEQNPLNLFYATKTGEWTWGVTAKYSNGKDDSVADKTKASSSGLALGATNGSWEFEITQGLNGVSEIGDAKVESKAMTQVGVGYKLNENMEVYGSYQMVKADGKSAAIASETVLDLTGFELGFVNTAVKTEDMNFFYGVAYRNRVTKFNNRLSMAPTKLKVEQTDSVLPIWLGVEANANSWLVFRGSIAQNVILNQDKQEVGAPANTSVEKDLDSTTIQAGVGIKLGNGMLDANFATAANGSLNFGRGAAADGSDRFLSNVAYTYNF